MFDRELRKLKDTLLIPGVKAIGTRIHPTTITIIAFFVGIAGAGAVFFGYFTLGLILWISNRILDGLDGAVARNSGKQSDIGGLLDLILDFFIYTLVPLAFAFRFNTRSHFIVVALLLASFYVNASIWMGFSALLEKCKANKSKQLTSMIMPRGVVEGFETIIFYTLMYVFPTRFVLITAVMAGFVTLGIIIRIIQAILILRRNR